MSVRYPSYAPLWMINRIPYFLTQYFINFYQHLSRSFFSNPILSLFLQSERLMSPLLSLLCYPLSTWLDPSIDDFTLVGPSFNSNKSFFLLTKPLFVIELSDYTSALCFPILNKLSANLSLPIFPLPLKIKPFFNQRFHISSSGLLLSDLNTCSAVILFCVNL